jgi:AcrR family transcriptional regulator
LGRKPMTQEQRAVMRQRILDAARDKLVNGGMNAISMRAVAASVGVSSMTIYLYYESRNDLLRHLVADGFRLLIGDLESAAFSKEPGRVARVARAYVQFAEEHPRYHAAMYRYVVDNPVQQDDVLLAQLVNRPFMIVAEAMTERLNNGVEATRQAVTLWCGLQGLTEISRSGALRSSGVGMDDVIRRLIGG